MTIRCGCPDQADDLVFGTDHQCSREGRAAVNLQAELDRLEPRYMETLDEAERRGD